MQDQGIGKRCQVAECRQIDWMPLTCKYCSKQFCADHYSIESHSCPQLDKNFKKVYTCPICENTLSINPNITVQQNLKLEFVQSVQFSIHEAIDCKGPRVSPKPNLCASKGCKEKLTIINKTQCTTCSDWYCLKHRLKEQHVCLTGYQKRWQS